MKKYGVLFTILIGITLLVGIIYLVVSQFRIKNVYIVSSVENIYGLEIFHESNLLFLDKNKVTKLLLEKNMFIEDVEIKYRYPISVYLFVKSRVPIAKIAHSSTFIFIDKNGIVFSDQKSSLSSPIVEIDSMNVTSGFPTDWRLATVAQYIDYLARVNLKTQKIIINNDSKIFHVIVQYNEEIFIPFSSDVSLIATSLQTIVTRFRIEGKLIRKIDFRFDKPIVVLSNGENN